MKSNPWTKREIESLVNLTLDEAGICEIAHRLRRAKKTVREMQVELELVDGGGLRRRWRAEEIKILKENYPHMLTSIVAKLLGKSVIACYGAATKHGLAKTAEFLGSPEACILRRDRSVGEAGRFKPGLVPHNKGVKRPGWSVGRMRETQFKKEARPHTWRPIGSTRVNDGYHQTKMTDTGYGPRDWVPTHVLLWREVKGPIPDGHVLCFIDGDKKHIAIDNLELVSRKELMRRNTIHNLPQDLVNTIMLLGAVKRKVRENAKKHNDGLAQPSV